MMQEWAADKNFKGLVSLVLLLVAVALGMYSYYAYRQADRLDQGTSTISVSGKSEQFLKPDVATFTFSVLAEEKDASAAQNKSAESINAIVAYLKEQGVDEKDIKTESYNLYPKYDYQQAVCPQTFGSYCPPGKQVQVGFTVEQSVSVKVRDIEKAGGLLSGIGDKGATNVSGLTFTVDDIDAAREVVREEAIKDAKEKARNLAGSLGVRLGKLMSFYEDNPGGPIPYGMGGYAGGETMKAMDSVAPTVNPGENKIVVTVNLNYEIR